ncbi:MAG: Gldg family protein [Planctomycetota bacterium]|nr:Gldg family protein [Planctomycetota bacterium]
MLDREMGEEVTLDLYRPENALDEAGSKATQFHGIMPRNEIQETVTGKDNVDVFLGAVVSCGARTQKIEYFDPGLSVEYELVRAIRTVSQEKKKVVGVVETDLKLMGGFDMQARQSLPEWEIVQEWKRQYDVRDVKLDAKVGDDVDVLVVPQPSRLGDLELRNLHDYVWDGRPALILEDPCPVFTSPTLGTSQPKRPPNPMMGMPPEDGEKGDLKPLLRALGIDVEADMVGWSDYLPSHEFRKILPPNFVCTDAPKGGIHEAAATRGIASLLLPFPGFIKEDAGKPKELTVTPLVTPIPSINWGKHGFNEHFENNPFFGMRRKEVKRWTPGSGEAPALAVEITGKLRRAYPRDEAPPAEEGKTGEKEDGAPGVGELGAKSAHVIYIADLDLASDQFFAFYRNSGERISEDVLKWLLDLRNVQFLANAVDALADDQAFLELRTRRPQRRPLAKIEGVIEATQKICREVEDAAQKEYEDEKERIEKEFEKELQAIDDRKDLDEHAKKQLKEQRRLSGRRDLDRQIEQLQRDAELKLRKAEIEQNRQVGGAQFWVKLWAILIPAAALSLVGGLVFLRRILGERTIVPESRRRS